MVTVFPPIRKRRPPETSIGECFLREPGHRDRSTIQRILGDFALERQGLGDGRHLVGLRPPAVRARRRLEWTFDREETRRSRRQTSGACAIPRSDEAARPPRDVVLRASAEGYQTRLAQVEELIADPLWVAVAHGDLESVAEPRHGLLVVAGGRVRHARVVEEPDVAGLLVAEPSPQGMGLICASGPQVELRDVRPWVGDRPVAGLDRSMLSVDRAVVIPAERPHLGQLGEDLGQVPDVRSARVGRSGLERRAPSPVVRRSVASSRP